MWRLSSASTRGTSSPAARISHQHTASQEGRTAVVDQRDLGQRPPELRLHALQVEDQELARSRRCSRVSTCPAKHG
jgi:hypothetical protein